jgi:hypothetical protein
MADRGNDDRYVRPLPVFNGTMNGPSKMGNDGDSYAVWRVRLVINLRAKRLLSIVTCNDDDEDSDDDEIQPSVQRRQACAAHIMTYALGTGPFLFVQGVNNYPAAILRILDTKYQGTDTSSVMSAVNEFTHQDVPSWSARGDICRRVRGTCHASGSHWSRSLGTDARCQLSHLAV